MTEKIIQKLNSGLCNVPQVTYNECLSDTHTRCVWGENYSNESYVSAAPPVSPLSPDYSLFSVNTHTHTQVHHTHKNKDH